jgi:hypothetical protein
VIIPQNGCVLKEESLKRTGQKRQNNFLKGVEPWYFGIILAKRLDPTFCATGVAA